MKKVLMLSDVTHSGQTFRKDAVVLAMETSIREESHRIILSYLFIDESQGVRLEIPFPRVERWVMNGEVKFL